MEYGTLGKLFYHIQCPTAVNNQQMDINIMLNTQIQNIFSYLSNILQNIFLFIEMTHPFSKLYLGTHLNCTFLVCTGLSDGRKHGLMTLMLNNLNLA